MYCSICGAELGDKLNYCNKCGTKLVKDDDGKRSKSILEGLVVSVSFIAICGFGILVGLVAVLLGNDVPHGGVGVIAVCYLVALLAICFFLLRPIYRLATGPLESVGKTNTNSEAYQPPHLRNTERPQLGESHQPVASVTEHTTRTLEEVLIDRK